MTLATFFDRASADTSLTRNAVWLMSAKTLAFAFTFLLPLLLVRQMTLAEFGLYKQAFLIIGTAVTIFPLGFAMSAFYFLPREGLRRGEVVLNIFIIYLAVGLASCLLFVLWPALPVSVFNSGELAEYSPLIGLAVLLWLAASFTEYVAIANDQVRFAAAFVTAAHFSRALLLIAAAALFGSLRSLLYAAVLHGALQFAVSLTYLALSFGRFWRYWSWDLMRGQLAYAIPLGAAGLLYVAQEDLHHYVVSHRFGAATYAIYAVGCAQIPFLTIVRESVGGVMIARVSALRQEGRTAEILQLTARMLRKLAAILLPLYFFLLVSGREFIAVLFTQQYLESWPIFAIYLTLIPSLFLATAYDPILRAHPEHFGFLFRVRAALIPLLVSGLIWATGRFQLIGAISVVVTVSALERLIVGFKVARILGLSAKDWVLFRDVGRILCAAMIGAVGALWCRYLIGGASPLVLLLGSAVAFLAAYGLAVAWFKILAPEELHVIERHLARMGLSRPTR